MALTIEMEFSERFEWRQMPKNYKPTKGDVVVETTAGFVRRESLGRGISTTAFRGESVVKRWQADRAAADLEHKPDHVLIAEHIAAGMVKENAPGRMTAVRVAGDPKLEKFLAVYFGVDQQAGDDLTEDKE
jgi:hypothetical protein